MSILESLRGFAKHFTNMTDSQQREFERALVDLENSTDITNLSTSLDLLRRNPDQSLPIPQITVTSGIRGGLVQWDAIPDQRIAVYEVEISSTSNFAVFSTVPTFGTQAVLNGLTSSVFVRVKGVRKDGTETPYSNVETITPRLFSVEIHGQEQFYVYIPKNHFYTVAKTKFTPIDAGGTSLAFGFISAYVNPENMIAGLNAIQVRLKAESINPANGAVTGTTILFSGSLGEYFTSYGVGPLPVTNPATLGYQLQLKLEIQDIVPDTLPPATQVIWSHVTALELGVSS